MDSYKKVFTISVFVITVVSMTGCFTMKKVERTFTPPEQLAQIQKGNNYIKAHMSNGDVFVFDNWIFTDEDSTISGKARHYNAYRKSVLIDSVSIAIGDIELIESNTVKMSGGAQALAFITGISAGVTVMCLTNTKACFGSCPTLYTDIDDSTAVLQAESFSASVLPSLEATDIDALTLVNSRDNEINLRLTNEALETHNIRFSNLLVFNHGEGEEVFADRNGNFLLAKPTPINLQISDEKGSIDSLINKIDTDFYYSLTDSMNLSTKEKLSLKVSGDIHQNKQYGLVIAGRQSLLSTFLFYQALSYLGENAGFVLSELERREKNNSQKIESMTKVLGDIELYEKHSENKKVLFGSFSETGPLATDVQIIPIPAGTDLNKMEISLTKGHWRIDQIKLVEIKEEATPLEIEPMVFAPDGEIDSIATHNLHNPKIYLTTLPGDEYILSYQLPKEHNVGSYFLKSRGYYLEWMRDEWLEDQNPAKAFEMFLKPKKMLRELAPVYKELESEMETIFWGSKYAAKEN